VRKDTYICEQTSIHVDSDIFVCEKRPTYVTRNPLMLPTQEWCRGMARGAEARHMCET